MNGTVVQFDERRGLGEIESAEGGRYLFHCTGIADGSRTIGLDVPVVFEVVPGPLGRWEAADIKPAAA